MTLCRAEIIGPVFCHCPEGDQVIVKPKLAERLNRCVGVSDSFVFKRREDTLWEHEEFQPCFFCVMKEDVFQS